MDSIYRYYCTKTDNADLISTARCSDSKRTLYLLLGGRLWDRSSVNLHTKYPPNPHGSRTASPSWRAQKQKLAPRCWVVEYRLLRSIGFNIAPARSHTRSPEGNGKKAGNALHVGRMGNSR